jgi:hypothetical protein
MFVIASIVQFSCTEDPAGTNSTNNKVKVVANDPGDPISPTAPPRPK